MSATAWSIVIVLSVLVAGFIIILVLANSKNYDRSEYQNYMYRREVSRHHATSSQLENALIEIQHLDEQNDILLAERTQLDKRNADLELASNNLIEVNDSRRERIKAQDCIITSLRVEIQDNEEYIQALLSDKREDADKIARLESGLATARHLRSPNLIPHTNECTGCV